MNVTKEQTEKRLGRSKGKDSRFLRSPEGCRRKMNIIDQDSLNIIMINKKRLYTSQWSIICKQKSRGLGYLNLDIHNKCLLSKWLFRLYNEEGLWQQVLFNKYLSHKTPIKMFSVDFTGVKDHLLSLCNLSLGTAPKSGFGLENVQSRKMSP